MASEPRDSPLNRAVALNVRRLREEMGLSQDQIADELGFHRTYWSAVERGKKNLTLQTIERLANRLDVQPLSLLQE